MQLEQFTKLISLDWNGNSRAIYDDVITVASLSYTTSEWYSIRLELALWDTHEVSLGFLTGIPLDIWVRLMTLWRSMRAAQRRQRFFLPCCCFHRLLDNWIFYFSIYWNLRSKDNIAYYNSHEGFRYSSPIWAPFEISPCLACTPYYFIVFLESFDFWEIRTIPLAKGQKQWFCTSCVRTEARRRSITRPIISPARDPSLREWDQFPITPPPPTHTLLTHWNPQPHAFSIFFVVFASWLFRAI